MCLQNCSLYSWNKLVQTPWTTRVWTYTIRLYAQHNRAHTYGTMQGSLQRVHHLHDKEGFIGTIFGLHQIRYFMCVGERWNESKKDVGKNLAICW